MHDEGPRPIDYLVIGHITADLLPDGSVRPGGTAIYAALTAHRLGLRTAVLTAHAPDLDLSSLPSDLLVLRQWAEHSTTFSNRYTGNVRTQHLHGQAPVIDLAQLPRAWQTARWVHLGPVVHEVPLPIVPFPGALIGATPQGWLRNWDDTGYVTVEPTRLRTLDLRGVTVVVMSEEDVMGEEVLALELGQRVPLVVLTRAERGATVWHAGSRYDVPASPAEVVDPTGAGDVFATAFFIALKQGQPPKKAARWACAAAACAIEGQGTSNLPTPAAIAAKLKWAPSGQR